MYRIDRICFVESIGTTNLDAVAEYINRRSKEHKHDDQDA